MKIVEHMIYILHYTFSQLSEAYMHALPVMKHKFVRTCMDVVVEIWKSMKGLVVFFSVVTCHVF